MNDRMTRIEYMVEGQTVKEVREKALAEIKRLSGGPDERWRISQIDVEAQYVDDTTVDSGIGITQSCLIGRVVAYFE